MKDKDRQELLIKGCIVGHLAGDAIGYHYRFTHYDRIPRASEIDMLSGPGVREVGTYTNSAALSLCTMASINDFADVNLEDIMERFHDCHVGGYLNYDAENYYIGTTSSQAIKNHSNGMPPDRCGLKDETDCEALTRILPVGLFFVNNVEMLIKHAHSICALTHNNIQSQVCCALYSLIVRNILLDRPEKVFEILSEEYKQKELAEYLQELKKIQASSEMESDDVSAIFWTAWRIFSGNERSYRNCIIKAVRLGGQINSVASIAGALCGLANGVNDIPASWLRSLKLTPEVMDVIETFVFQLSRP